ncbi:MAG: Gldg family protein [Clostridia bacterium]|nr:Gldg family protein [Clostridia bacterium]
MKAVWKREMQGYFFTAAGYVFLGVFLTVSSVLFYLEILNQRSGDLPTFIGEMSYLWMLLSPVLTMRLLAEEKQKKTDRLLLSSPVSLIRITAGKYLAAVTMLAMAALLTLLYALVVALYGRVYPAELAVNYLGFLLQGCAFAALDLFMSGCAATPATAAVLAFGANFLLWILDLLENAVQVGWISEVLRFCSLYARNESFLMGQLSFAGILFDVSFTVLFLALTVYRLNRDRTGQGTLRSLFRKKNAGRKERRYAAVTLVLLAGSLIALNIGAETLEKRYGWRGDYSFNSISTHSGVTKDTLEHLEHPVHMTALFRKGDEDAPLIELLNRYAAASNLVTWEQADPGLNPALLQRFTTDSAAPGENSLIVFCEETGKWRILGPGDYVSLGMDTETGEYSYTGWTYERSITNAIAWVTREKTPKIVIVQGHGELAGDALTHFDGLLSANRFEVIYADLGRADYTPDPEDALVFFSPQTDINEEELAKLQAFANAGGSFLFTCDYSDPVARMPRLAALMRSYGFQPLDGIILADRKDPDSYYNGNRMYLIPEMCSTDLTMDLIGSGAVRILLQGARGFAEPEETDRNLVESPLLRSAETAYRKVLTGDSTSLEKAEGDEDGPFTLALQARRVTGGGYVSRACAVGCSAMLTDGQVYSMTDCQQLIVRMAEFLLNLDASDLNIMAKEATRPALGIGSLRTGAVLITLLPAAVLLSALLVLRKRKTK